MAGRKAPAVKAREAALRALVRVEQDDAYLNLAFPPLLKPLPPRERALAVRMTKGTIQRLNTLDWALNLFSRHPVDKMTPWIRNLLRLAAYQVLYMEKIPDYALVDQSVNLARQFGHQGVAGLVNAVLRRLVRESGHLPWPDPSRSLLEHISLAHSHPQWLVKRALERFGAEGAEKWCRANNEIPLPTVRPNRLRTTADELAEILKEEGFSAIKSPDVPGILQVSGPFSPASTGAFRKGYFTIQGESSALVAPLTGIQPGDTAVDLCSAPGGKTTHLAEMIEDQGRVYAVEMHQNRLNLVEKAARRLGLQSITPVFADGRDIENRGLPAPEAVLVDAPCSGLGVIRRLPEIKWRRKEAELAGFQELQLALLQAASRILAPGGKLLYSVCSTEPEETSHVVEAFNKTCNGFELQPIRPLMPRSLQDKQEQSFGEGPVFIYPHLHSLDGFFIALWIKRS